MLATAAIVAGSCLLYHYACVNYAHMCLKYAQDGCHVTIAANERLRALGSLLNFLSAMVAVCGTFVLLMAMFTTHALSVGTDAILRKEFNRIAQRELPRELKKTLSGENLTEL